MLGRRFTSDQTTKTSMHKIGANYGRFHRICKTFFEEEADWSGNLEFYSRKTQMSDLEIIALSCVTEALGIDSENLLWENCRTITRTCSPSFSAVPALIAAGEGCCPISKRCKVL